jgi:uncharacterized protein DUF6362
MTSGKQPITASDLEDLFEEAARTLRRLPNPPGSGPKGYGSSWPEYIHEAKDAYGYEAAQMRVIPSATDIANMEICLDWLRLVKPDDAKIIWLRAEGRRWRHVCIEAGCVRQTAWRRWVAALATIAKKVSRERQSRMNRPGLTGVNHSKDES